MKYAGAASHATSASEENMPNEIRHNEPHPATPTDDAMIAKNAVLVMTGNRIDNDVLNQALQLVFMPIDKLWAMPREPLVTFVIGARLARGDQLPTSLR